MPEPLTQRRAMITQLNPPLPLHTPKGPGLAHFVIDYGPEADLMWVVFMDKDGACWSVPNPEIRIQFNWSMGRRKSEPEQNATPLAPVHRVFPRTAE
ncbi:MAG: hypothetical protein WDN48_02505 [Pseudolabrys sp.]